MARVTQCILLDNHRIELYWDGDVTGSDDAGNGSVSVAGKAKHLHVWRDPEEWDKGCVYEDGKRRTTLYVEEFLYPYEAEKIHISFSDGVKARDGGEVERSVDCAAQYRPFYRKYTASKCGIVIKSSGAVSDEAHRVAAETADLMLGKMPEVAAVMRRFHAEVAIYALNEDVYDIPEHRFGYRILHRPVEGFGGVSDLPVTSIAERNLLRVLDGPHATRYRNEFIMAHEFGHAVHLIGINYLADQTKAKELLRAYENACRLGRWPKTYAIGNYEEYFATLTTIWFDVMAESNDGTWDGVRGPINKRDELKEFDPEAYEFFRSIYPEEHFGGKWAETPRFFHPDGSKRE